MHGAGLPPQWYPVPYDPGGRGQEIAFAMRT
jgi:hypothetical protein